MFKIKKNKLATIFSACALFAFYFFASISDFLNITNGLLTWGFRGTAVLLSLTAFFLYFSKHKYFTLSKFEYAVIISLFSFLIMYSFAIFRSIVNYESFSMSEINYVLWLLFICLIPSLIFININVIQFKPFVVVSSVLLLFIVILTPINYYNMLTAGENLNTRIQSYSVNPISYGHSAISLAIISFCAIKEDFHKYSFSIIFLICIFFAFLSGSRGAVLSFFAVLSLYLIINFRVKYLIKAAIILLIGIFISLLLIEHYEVTVFDSFLNVGSKTDLSANIRYQSYEGGLGQFEQHFLFGDHIEERTTGFYPHNILIEVLMSTGLFGFILFFLPLLFITTKALYSLKTQGIQCLVALLFLQFLFGAMFSGSIFANYSLWYMVVALLFSQTAYVKSPHKSLLRLHNE